MRVKEKQEKEPGPEFTYDVFVCYSPGEERWVLEHLLPEMEEREPRIRVCVQQRDFQVHMGAALKLNIQ